MSAKRRNPAKEAWHHLYNNKRWRRRRALQLAEHPLCAMCLEMGRTTAATVADHVEPHRGDPDAFWSGALQSLCATCHSSAKQAAEHGHARPAIGLDGWPVGEGGSNV